MRIYRVGGAVRDSLLGLPVHDTDWVVVGATPEQMSALGYRPVGRDFPVFLHPESHEEYALARTERKTARGYHGFAFNCAPDVTLEQDLARRDLTINAIAMDDAGGIIDPFGGQRDLQARVLRHVSDAFAEDPVRILRLARFAARFADFEVAPETLSLMRSMTEAGEVDALVPERVWQELARGLGYRRPSRMFEQLRACGALARILPELDALWGVPQPPEHHPEIDTGVHVMLALDVAASSDVPLEVRFAVLTHDLGKALTPPQQWPRHIGHEAASARLVEQVCMRLRVPNACRDLAVLVAREHTNIFRIAQMRPATRVALIERLDLLRRPERLEAVLAACAADLRGRTGMEQAPFAQAELMRSACKAARSVDAGAIARTCQGDAARIAAALRAARARAVALTDPDSDPAREH